MKKNKSKFALNSKLSVHYVHYVATGGRALCGDCDPQAILSNPPLLRKYVTSMQMWQNGGQFGVNKLKKPSMSNHNQEAVFDHTLKISLIIL
jgi:hypothetical protein